MNKEDDTEQLAFSAFEPGEDPSFQLSISVDEFLKQILVIVEAGNQPTAEAKATATLKTVSSMPESAYAGSWEIIQSRKEIPEGERSRWDRLPFDFDGPTILDRTHAKRLFVQAVTHYHPCYAEAPFVYDEYHEPIWSVREMHAQFEQAADDVWVVPAMKYTPTDEQTTLVLEDGVRMYCAECEAVQPHQYCGDGSDLDLATLPYECQNCSRETICVTF
jgi:hypothetical protein